MKSIKVPGSDIVYSVDPNDLVICTNNRGHTTTYKVDAVCLGGIGEASIVELIPIDQTYNCQINIPIEILNAAISTEQISIYKG